MIKYRKFYTDPGSTRTWKLRYGDAMKTDVQTVSDLNLYE